MLFLAINITNYLRLFVSFDKRSLDSLFCKLASFSFIFQTHNSESSTVSKLKCKMRAIGELILVILFSLAKV